MKTVKDGNLYKAVKQVERQYWKREETEQPWTQPVLSANGTIGGDSFACAASSELSGCPAWRAFDNSTYLWTSAQNQQNNSWLEWYNPKKINITTLKFWTGGDYGMGVIKNFKIQASNDNSTWVDIETGATSSNTKVTITKNININQGYKYWRIFVIDTWDNAFAGIDDVVITATQLIETIVSGTAEDYDFYTEETVYKGVNI